MSKTIANSQFIKLLRSLNKDELGDFEKKLKMIGEVEYKVFKFILKFKPNFNSEKLDKERAFKLIFKNEKYSYPKITNALSTLKKYLEEFLIQQELKNQPFTRNYLLIQNLNRRNADDFFYKKIKDVRNDLERKTKIDTWHFLKILQLNHIVYYKANAGQMKAENSLIEKIMKSLDEFFVASKLKYASELFNRKNISQDSKSISIFNLENHQESGNENSTFLDIFSLALKLTAYGNTELYLKVKEKLFKFGHLLTKYDLQVVNGYLLNFSNLEIKKGNEDFVREAFNLYKFAEDNDFLMIDGHITTMRFFNIMNIASNLKEVEWAEKFVNRWSEFLDSPDKNEVIEVGKAMIFFGEKEYSKVIDSIRKVNKFDNILNEVRGRSLAMRSYYELDNSTEDLLVSMCNSLSIQIKRNKSLSENAKKPLLAFIKIFKKLLKKDVAYNELLRVFNENPSTICKKWLLDKIEKFKPRS